LLLILINVTVIELAGMILSIYLRS